MRHKILEKTKLNSVIWKITVDAPFIANSVKAGQFVIVKLGEKGERVPLTVNDKNPAKGTITIIFQEAGTSTKKLGCLKENDYIMDILGPLGKPTDFGNVGKVMLVAGGVGIAEILPIARYAKAEGNEVVTIIGARTKELLILEEELKKICNRLFVTTDDGSHGQKGLVVTPLKQILNKEKFGLSYVVGPDIMMKFVCLATKEYGLKTLISLDANMVDATGMCGTCRVKVGDKVLFTCVDGPEFDGHLVDWDEFLKRQKRFMEEEKRSLSLFQSQHKNCMYKV